MPSLLRQQKVLAIIVIIIIFIIFIVLLLLLLLFLAPKKFTFTDEILPPVKKQILEVRMSDSLSMCVEIEGVR